MVRFCTSFVSRLLLQSGGFSSTVNSSKVTFFWGRATCFCDSESVLDDSSERVSALISSSDFRLGNASMPYCVTSIFCGKSTSIYSVM